MSIHRKAQRDLGAKLPLLHARELCSEEEETEWIDYGRSDYDDTPDPDASPLCGALARYGYDRDLAGILATLAANPALDLDGNGRDYEMPLHAACAGGSLDCVAALLDAGATPWVLDRNGCSPISMAIASPVGLWPHESGAICRLLASRGAPIDEPDLRGRTPFLSACAACDLSAAQALADLGADIWALDRDGAGAFDLAEAVRRRRGPGGGQGAGVDPRGPMLDWLGAMAERDELREAHDGAADPKTKPARRI